MRMQKRCLRYQDIFGKGNFFLELQDHGIPEQQTVNQQLLKMHRETGIELVATNDVHYTWQRMRSPMMYCSVFRQERNCHDENRMRYDGGQYYVKSPEEMREAFSLCYRGSGEYAQDCRAVSCGD